MCKPYATYQLINTANQLMLIGGCSDGCKYSKSVSYQYSIQYNTGEMLNVVWSNPTGDLSNEIVGNATQSVAILPSFFAKFPSSLYKVSLSITSDNVTGVSSAVYKGNSLPMGGTCSVDLTKGIALSTWFTITCMGWYDMDGVVARYEFYG